MHVLNHLKGSHHLSTNETVKTQIKDKKIEREQIHDLTSPIQCLFFHCMAWTVLREEL